MSFNLKGALLSALVLAFWPLNSYSANLEIERPCTQEERWMVVKTETSDKDSVIEEEQMRRIAAHFPALREVSAIGLLSEALFSRRIASTNALLRAASEYALGRALERLGLIHAAHRTYQRSALTDAAPVAVASQICLSTLISRYPSLGLEKPEAIHGATVRSLAHRAPHDALGELALRSGFLSNPEKPAFSKKWIESSGENTAWAGMARGLQFATLGDPAATVNALERVLQGHGTLGVLPEEYLDIIKITMARALSELGRHTEAERQLHSVSKASNLLPAALTEIAWQRLNAGKLREAVGAALSLQTGAMNRVFAPESLLVLGMALNELCRYPEAQQALNLLRKNYGDSAQWFASGDGTNEKLEPLALAALARAGKRAPEGVKSLPRRLETELFASPIFQESQREKRLWKDELKALEQVPILARDEQRKITQKIQELSTAIKKRLKDKSADRAGTRALVLQLRETLRTEKKLRESAPFGRALLAKQKKEQATRSAALSVKVERDLHARIKDKDLILREVVDQASLVEIEVQQGGGKDIILTHARGLAPGQKEKPANEAQGRWNWGTRTAASLEDGEVWEDELGAFEADLPSRCGKR
jgi:hypothetical protein